jgi:hypothetical protein
MFATLLAAHKPLPPEVAVPLFGVFAVICFIIVMVGPAGPTDAARARRRRKYANRCYLEGRTYTPRPHLHVTGRLRGYHTLGLGTDPRVRADGVPYIRREPKVAYTAELSAADLKAARQKAAKKKAYDAAHRCVWTGLDKDVRTVAFVCLAFAVAVSSAIAVAAS